MKGLLNRCYQNACTPIYYIYHGQCKIMSVIIRSIPGIHSLPVVPALLSFQQDPKEKQTEHMLI